MSLNREALALALVLAGCSARTLPSPGHVLVRFDTDAPLPTAAPGAPVPVFDSLLVELLAPDGSPSCATCSRELALSRELVTSGATMTVVAERPVVVHAVLYDSALGVARRDPERVVETWALLPPPPAEGERAVTVPLPVASLGVPLGSLAGPVVPSADAAPLVPIGKTPWTGAAGADEVCVDGALFWMGSARLPTDEGGLSNNAPRLVRVSPFCISANAVTVAEARAAKIDLTGVTPWGGSTDPALGASFCTFTAAPGPNDARPITCIDWQTARAYCDALGADLPSEAQLEFVGSAFGASTFVWGNDVPSCDDAIFARAVGLINGDSSCRKDNTVAFLPVTADELAATRDVLAAPRGRITGLASNVGMWTREPFGPFVGSACFPAVGPLADPSCPITTTPALVSIRGAPYTATAGETAAAVRNKLAPTTLRPDVGFRCAR